MIVVLLLGTYRRPYRNVRMGLLINFVPLTFTLLDAGHDFVTKSDIVPLSHLALGIMAACGSAGGLLTVYGLLRDPEPLKA